MRSTRSILMRCPSCSRSRSCGVRPSPIGGHRVGQRLPKLRERKRLRQVVEDLQLERRAHVLERRVAGDDDHADSRVPRLQLLEHLLALELAHLHVEQDDVGRPALRHATNRSSGCENGTHGVTALILEKILHVTQEVDVVVQHGDVDQRVTPASPLMRRLAPPRLWARGRQAHFEAGASAPAGCWLRWRPRAAARCHPRPSDPAPCPARPAGWSRTPRRSGAGPRPGCPGHRHPRR